MEPSKETIKEYKNLIKKIEYHNNLYYNEDAPEISDYEYDLLTMSLKKIEKDFPSLVTPDSPSQKITGTVKRELGIEVSHDVPMLSLLDVFSKDDVKEFIDSMKDRFPDCEFIVEQKIDGLSLSVEYKNGMLTCGSTRGNGLIGEDVTPNVKMLKHVPQTVESLPLLEVRGECFMSKEEFKKANSDKNDDKHFKNERNCAAGTLRQTNPALVKKRGLDIIIFNLQKVSGKEFRTHSETLEYLKTQGFFVSPDYKICKTLEEVIGAIDEIGKKRTSLTYGIDGAVIKINSLAQREILGNTSKTPRWAVAYKYPPMQAETVIRKIEPQVGRTGRITPVAIFDEILLDGSSIKKATLHNKDQVEKLDIMVGDTVIIQKAGDIIPEVVSVVKEKRPDCAVSYKVPKTCPVCGALVKDEKCTNPNCKAKLYLNIEFFADRQCMNIKGMGPAVVSSLIDGGYIKDISDIYCLKEKRAELIEKNIIGKEKTVDNLLSSIEASKTRDLPRLIKALGVPNIGEHAGKALSLKCGSLENISNASFEDIVEIDGIGETSALTISEYFKKEETKKLISKLSELGVNTKKILHDNTGNLKLSNVTIAMTGTLPTLSRKDAVDIIEKNGGKVSSSVSKNTDYLLCGENAGSKLEKANSLGVKIISEKDFLKLVE